MNSFTLYWPFAQNQLHNFSFSKSLVAIDLLYSHHYVLVCLRVLFSSVCGWIYMAYIYKLSNGLFAFVYFIYFVCKSLRRANYYSLGAYFQCGFSDWLALFLIFPCISLPPSVAYTLNRSFIHSFPRFRFRSLYLLTPSPFLTTLCYSNRGQTDCNSIQRISNVPHLFCFNGVHCYRLQ